MNVPRLVFRLLLGRRLPTTSGDIEVPDLKRPVLIRRDGYGIPYVEAEEEEDGWYGLGFCQGQDRTFQLESLLRVSRGTVAELIGPKGLVIDRLSRRIGFLDSAQRQMPALDPAIRSVLEAFARGLTDGSRLGCKRVPHEFTLLRARPTPFAAVDLVAMGKLQAFALPSNWDVELARLQIMKMDGPEALAALDPGYPEWLPVSSPPGAPSGPAVDRLAADLQELARAAGPAAGSNSWAVDASRTATGRPILANDPHLTPSLPPHWYLAHLRTPKWSAAGATFVGAPSFPVGHNEVAAWGVTAGLLDNTDLFLEEVGPAGNSVREGDRFVPCQVRREVIRVKGEPDVVEEVLVTPRGPIIGPALDSDVGAISIRATWLDPHPIEGLLTMHRARSFDEFRGAFERWSSTPLNMSYADTSGDIGWLLVGEAPRRRKGFGTVPFPGWDPDAGWEDQPVAFDEMPFALNPADGALATANNRPVLDGEGPFLGIDWIDGYRVARILESLKGRRDWDLPEVAALQVDQESIPWREIRDNVLATPVESAEAREGMALLKGWDGVVASDSPAAAVFEYLLAEVSRLVAEAKAPRSSRWALGHGLSTLVPYTMLAYRRAGHLSLLLRDRPNGWFAEGWDRVVEDTLASAVKTLRHRYGEDHGRWAWGHIRTLTLKHPIGGRTLLGRIFNLGPFPWGGDANTVGQAAVNPTDPSSNPLAIASLRMIADVGSWEDCRFSLPGGQSGNPLSPHYSDMLPLWRRAEGVPIAWSPERIDSVARTALRLSPAA